MAVRYDIWIPPVLAALLLGWAMLLYSVNSPVLLGLVRLLSCSNKRKKRTTKEEAGTQTSDLAELASVARSAIGQAANPETAVKVNAAATAVQQSNKSDFACAKPVSLRWVDVDWYVTDKGSGNEKHLLHFCSGNIVPGELAALMGPSGAGKSTLLNLLAMQKTRGRLDGQILCNGQPRNSRDFKLLSTYVEQEDTFFPSLSVLETVTFHAKLRQAKERTNTELREYIEEIVALMGLGKTLHTRVGGVLPGGIKVRGLSGGEKRRLSVICAVVKGPSLIFLDEPTSGLDSFAAIQVMKYMKGLAAVNHTVIASIHQPPQAIWNSFDKVVLMSEGHCLYSGLTTKVVPWFAGQLGYPYEPVADGPVPEWVLQLIAVGFSKAGFPGGPGATMREYADVVAAAELLRENIDNLRRLPEYKPPPPGGAAKLPGGTLAKDLDAAHDSALTGELGRRVSIVKTVIKHASGASAGGRMLRQGSSLGQRTTTAITELLNVGSTDPIYTASWWAQFRVLFWRNWLSYVRNPADVAGRLLVSLLIGLVIGLVFLNLPDDLTTVDTRLRVLADELIISMLMPFIYMSLLAANRSYFAGEISGELYSCSAYYCAVFFASLPLSALNAMVPSLTVYGLAGLRYTAKAVLGNTLILALHHICATQVVQLAAYMFPNQDLASAAAVAFICVCLQLGGFFFIVDNLIRPLFGISFLSFARYSYEASVKLELDERAYPCPPAGFAVTIGGAALPNSCAAAGDVITGNQIRSALGMKIGFWASFGILVAYICVVALLGYAALLLLARSSRYAEGKPSGGGRGSAPPRMMSTLEISDLSALSKVESGLPSNIQRMNRGAMLDLIAEDGNDANGGQAPAHQGAALLQSADNPLGRAVSC